MARVMALRSLHSQLVAQVCAHRKRALQIKRMREMTLSLLRFWVMSRKFVYARARNEVNSKDFVHAMYARAWKCCHFHCMQGLKRCKCCAYKGSKILKGSKCSYFVRVCACRNSKCFNFQALAIFKVLCMQDSIYRNFLRFCACRSSTCFTFQGCVNERAPNAAWSASLSRGSVHARVPHASICCIKNCQIIGHRKKHKLITEFAKKIA